LFDTAQDIIAIASVQGICATTAVEVAIAANQNVGPDVTKGGIVVPTAVKALSAGCAIDMVVADPTPIDAIAIPVINVIFGRSPELHLIKPNGLPISAGQVEGRLPVVPESLTSFAVKQAVGEPLMAQEI
jgi:hypothetical protein